MKSADPFLVEEDRSLVTTAGALKNSVPTEAEQKRSERRVVPQVKSKSA
jgi:hypothetical protein